MAPKNVILIQIAATLALGLLFMGVAMITPGDGGAAWALLYPCYCRAAWVDPADAAHIVLGPADGVSRGGRIEESRDGGQSWQAGGAEPAGPGHHQGCHASPAKDSSPEPY